MLLGIFNFKQTFLCVKPNQFRRNSLLLKATECNILLLLQHICETYSKKFVFILTAIEKPDSYTIMVFTNLIQIPNRMEFFTQCRQFKIQFQDFIYIVCKNDEDEKYSLWHRLTFSFLSPIRQ